MSTTTNTPACPKDIPAPAAVYIYRTGTYAMALDHRPDVADPRPLTADAQHRAYRDYHQTLADVPTADVDQTYAAVLTAIYGAPWPAGRAPVVGVRL